MNWEDQIPACFGCVDQIFAEHPLDEERAIKMLKDAFLSGASESDVLTALCDYMKSKNCPASHIDEQINKAKEYIRSNNIKV
jgi:hypothetical protein